MAALEALNEEHGLTDDPRWPTEYRGSPRLHWVDDTDMQYAISIGDEADGMYPLDGYVWKDYAFERDVEAIEYVRILPDEYPVTAEATEDELQETVDDLHVMLMEFEEADLTDAHLRSTSPSMAEEYPERVFKHVDGYEPAEF